MPQKQNKDIAWDDYRAILKNVLKTEVEDERHQKDVIKLKELKTMIIHKF